MTTLATADLMASKPVWAKALIVAEYEADKTDIMTDYFATSTTRTVALAWSKHTKDLFSEMRKAAAKFSETAHLGPGKDLYTASVRFVNDVVSNGTAYWKGSPSHWHTEFPTATFSTLDEAEAYIRSKGVPHSIGFDGIEGHFTWHIDYASIEHREKYSMGHGYYLKGSGRYSSGWIVRKTSGRYLNGSIESVIDKEEVAA